MKEEHIIEASDDCDAGIRRMMQAFDPALGPDNLFMSRLRRDMDAMELVKSRSRRMRGVYRRAVAIAAFVGFLTGIGLTLLWQTLMPHMSLSSLSMPRWGGGEISIDWNYAIWLVLALAVVAVSVNAYELAVNRLSARVRSL